MLKRFLMMKIKAVCILGIVLLFSCERVVVDSPSIDLSNNFFPKGTTDQIVRHKYYTLSYSEPDEQAEWVAYLLTSKMPSSAFERADDFREDPLVATGSAALTDYVGSGYDRGHLCPAADMSFAEDAMSDTFYMSNMSPQNASFNRGIWSQLEAQVRSWALSYDSLYVITGPVLISKKGKIGANEVTVPYSYYKVILDYCQPGIKMIAFILPNEKGTGSLESYAVKTDSIEKITGIDFFPSLPDDLETKLESTCIPSDWIFGASNVQPISLLFNSSTSPSNQCLGITKSIGQQ